jgi:hypothetical protein
MGSWAFRYHASWGNVARGALARGALLSLEHPSVWKVYPRDFAYPVFCDLRLYGVLRSSLHASNAKQRQR